MHKATLIKLIAKQTGVEHASVAKVVESYTNQVVRAVTAGERVDMRGFGCFKRVMRKAKVGRNISTGAPVHIPEHFEPVFEPADNFKVVVKHQLSHNLLP